MCPPCLNTSFERLYCRCRRSFMEPPVPCGTKPPNCNHPCCIPRACGHAPNHPCHIEEECPPCVVPVQKYCPSHSSPLPFLHPCYIQSVSCGRKCGHVLTCCQKRCENTCHPGHCVHKCVETFPTLESAHRAARREPAERITHEGSCPA
jgi:hypothetical protein